MNAATLDAIMRRQLGEDYAMDDYELTNETAAKATRTDYVHDCSLPQQDSGRGIGPMAGAIVGDMVYAGATGTFVIGRLHVTVTWSDDVEGNL